MCALTPPFSKCEKASRVKMLCRCGMPQIVALSTGSSVPVMDMCRQWLSAPNLWEARSPQPSAACHG
eukprot:jgi/Mesen1/664/ME000109S10886